MDLPKRAKQQREMLSSLPVPRSRSQLEYVNSAESEEELQAIRTSCRRGTPYGRPGRPRKKPKP